jgi:hypothetical protein
MDDQSEDRKSILSLILRLHEEFYYFGSVACLIATAYLMFRWGGRQCWPTGVFSIVVAAAMLWFRFRTRAK